MGRLPASFAEYAVMDKADAITVPQGLSWEEAAATPLTFLVVYDMLVQQGDLKKANGSWSPASRPASASPPSSPARRSARR